MEWYHLTLLALVLGALALAWRVPRAALWIGGAVASYVVSVGYFRWSAGVEFWVPNGAVVAFLCDALLFLLIREFHRFSYEFHGLGVICLIMATLNLLYFSAQVLGAPPLPPHDVYAILLELLNVAYLACIGGAGLVERLGRRAGSRHTVRPPAAVAAACHAASARAFARTTARQPLRRW